ncbi:MAG: YceI family protein [Terriglobales bacterium]
MPTTWNIDPVHTSIQFVVRHMMVSNVRGVFSKSKGTVTVPDSDLTRGQVEVEVDVTSLDTREPQRDTHLRSPDFLDAEKHPAIRFRSTAITRAGAGYSMTGDLTVHGVTRPITLEVEPPAAPAKDPWGGTRWGFEAHGEINRKDYGLVWNQALETGGVLVGEKIKINLEVELIQG